jgi:copper chaperone CopZ
VPLIPTIAITLALLATIAPGSVAAGEPAAAAEAPADTAVVQPTLHVLTIPGMTCSGCAGTVRDALLGNTGVTSAVVSHIEGKACIEASPSLEFVALSAALKVADYQMTGHEKVNQCPKGLRGTLPDPWDGRSEGLDVLVVSRGEEVDLKAHQVAGKYTIIDFGAPWCEPCHVAVEALVPYLQQHPDVAVRAVSLDSQDPSGSYELPVVAQHLQYVRGVPWFVVHAPGGRVLHKGMDVEAVMKAIDKHRKRKARKG